MLSIYEKMQFPEIGHIRYFIFKTFKTGKSINHLPHMEYERSIGLLSRKMNKKICSFSFFRTKQHDLSVKKISVCHAPLPLQKFVSTLAQSL
jgi:hypothetical protein